jgi:hypothetical protein
VLLIQEYQLEVLQVRHGANGTTPAIGANGNWFVGTTDTGVPARGTTGATGANGTTPTIGANGNWVIGTTDTGVPARGATGATRCCWNR